MWCCWDKQAWLLATVQRRFRHPLGWLQAYIVLVQQDGQEDFETKVTDIDQVRMHYFPGNRVQSNQVQSLKVSASSFFPSPIMDTVLYNHNACITNTDASSADFLCSTASTGSAPKMHECY